MGLGRRRQWSCGSQTADPHQVRQPGGELLMPRRIQKLREVDTKELEVQQRELSEQIFRLRFQLSTGQAEALKRLRETRKDLARVKTLLRERTVRKDHGN